MSNTIISNFLNQCRNNPNEPQHIINETKSDFLKMATEQGLYAQVIMILRNESDDKKGVEDHRGLGDNIIIRLDNFAFVGLI